MEYSDEELFSSYMEFENLKLAANSIGIKWQTLYWRLKVAGYPVVGNKKKYGSITDKLAVKSEELFNYLVPTAINQNKDKFQNKIDFKVGNYLIDVKSSTKKVQNGYRTKKSAYLRWAFGITESQVKCDFLVCFCYGGTDAEHTLKQSMEN